MLSSIKTHFKLKALYKVLCQPNSFLAFSRVLTEFVNWTFKNKKVVNNDKKQTD